MSELQGIVEPLLRWWDEVKADLPWRRSRDPYAVWVSEMMLQQTQVGTVIPYFERWMARFPDLETLANASLAEVLKAWEGLGYYSRARSLHSTAQEVQREWNGRLPDNVPDLLRLKGIGPYTAGAIVSIAYNKPAPVLDGNVIRVLTRLADISGDVTTTPVKNALWQLAGELVPAERPGDYNQALMELGQKVCGSAKPFCLLCPLREMCLAQQRGTQLERPSKPPRKSVPHYEVVAAIIWRDPEPSANGQFLIAQRPLDGLLGGLWEFPGGKQEPDEELAETLVREIEEELGVLVVNGRYVTTIKHAYTHFRITLHAYHAHLVSGEPQNIGVADHAWVTLPELDNYAFAVTDQKIIVALEKELLG